jgi:hypothetical protein
LGNTLISLNGFSPGTPASSTTKTGRHDKAEILLKVALNIKIKSNQITQKYPSELEKKDTTYIWMYGQICLKAHLKRNCCL